MALNYSGTCLTESEVQTLIDALCPALRIFEECASKGLNPDDLEKMLFDAGLSSMMSVE